MVSYTHTFRFLLQPIPMVSIFNIANQYEHNIGYLQSDLCEHLKNKFRFSSEALQSTEVCKDTLSFEDPVNPESIQPADDRILEGKRILAYLGTLERFRKIEILFQMLAQIRLQIPNIMLILVGDIEDADHRDWLKQEAERMGVADHVLWTGWLSSSKAWSYVRAAELGLSPIPRGYLLDMGSPTKTVEYMALGLPVVANDNPDQVQVIEESGAGICVPLQVDSFAQAVIGLLNSPNDHATDGCQRA